MRTLEKTDLLLKSHLKSKKKIIFRQDKANQTCQQPDQFSTYKKITSSLLQAAKSLHRVEDNLV